MLDYEVRIYAPETIAVKRVPAMWIVQIVIRDGAGAQLFSGELQAEGITHLQKSKEEFRVLRFSVHKSVETTTAINIGRHNGIRVLYTPYRLPLTSVDHPKAHR